MLSHRFGHVLDRPLAPVARARSLSPNAVTVLGTVITSSSALVIPFSLFAGGLIILAGGFFDLLDGAIARINNRKTDLGAFLDSSLDRIADGFIFLGLCVYFFRLEHGPALVVTILGLMASLIISYVRARPEALGQTCSVGLIERPERLILISLGCLFSVIWPVIIALAVLSWITVFQRIIHVRRKLSP